MSRTLEVSLPSERSSRLVEELVQTKGVIGVSLQRNASIKPEGDVITVHASNDGMQPVLSVLASSLGTGSSIITSEPRSAVSTEQRTIDREHDEASWPEMATMLRRETNLTVNYLIAMFFAGAIAAVGIWTSTIHIIVGAMVIAPGFEPIIRVPFGLLAKDRQAWAQGLSSTAGGYIVLIAGAALAAAILRAVQPDVPALGELRWVEYWSKFEITSALIGFAAGAAGAAIIAAHRSVLTAGVMIALALIPSASIVGMALAAGELGLAGEGLLRWGADVVLVIVGGGLVFCTKRLMMPDGRIARVGAPLQ